MSGEVPRGVGPPGQRFQRHQKLDDSGPSDGGGTAVHSGEQIAEHVRAQLVERTRVAVALQSPSEGVDLSKAAAALAAGRKTPERQAVVSSLEDKADTAFRHGAFIVLSGGIRIRCEQLLLQPGAELPGCQVASAGQDSGGDFANDVSGGRHEHSGEDAGSGRAQFAAIQRSPHHRQAREKVLRQGDLILRTASCQVQGEGDLVGVEPNAARPGGDGGHPRNSRACA